jgi:hypothetical protein
VLYQRYLSGRHRVVPAQPLTTVYTYGGLSFQRPLRKAETECRQNSSKRRELTCVDLLSEMVDKESEMLGAKTLPTHNSIALCHPAELGRSH